MRWGALRALQSAFPEARPESTSFVPWFPLVLWMLPRALLDGQLQFRKRSLGGFPRRATRHDSIQCSSLVDDLSDSAGGNQDGAPVCSNSSSRDVGNTLVCSANANASRTAGATGSPPGSC